MSIGAQSQASILRENKKWKAHPQQGRTEENFQAFAQAITENRPLPSKNLAPPQHRSVLLSHQPPPQSSPIQQHHYSQDEFSSRPSSSGSNKGKSPINNAQQNVEDPGNGLGLDPSVFSRDTRSQIPSSLSQGLGDASIFPSEGEAWSESSPGNLIKNSGGHQLTPSTLFGTNTYGAQQEGYNDGGTAGRDVLEGLSGFMNDENRESWERISSLRATVKTFEQHFMSIQTLVRVCWRRSTKQVRRGLRDSTSGLSRSRWLQYNHKTLPNRPVHDRNCPPCV